MTLLAAALLGFTAPAEASPKFVFDLHHDWTFAMADSGGKLGGGVGGDVGIGLGLVKVIKFVPEIGATWYYTDNIAVLRGGGKFLVGFIVMPGVYAHANTVFGGPFGGEVGFDGGFSLDIDVPFVRFGGYGGLMMFGGPSAPGIPDQNFVGGIQVTVKIPLKAVMPDPGGPDGPGPL